MSDQQKQSKQAKTAAQASKLTKTIFQTESPFPTSEWPTLDKGTNEAIIDLLRDLLEPIGHYRATNLQTSRAKHQRKRKRKSSNPPTSLGTAPSEPDLPPAVLSSTLIGYNTVIRHLQQLTQRPTPKSESPSTRKGLPVIFLTGNSLYPPYAQLPLLSALASQQSNTEIRLVLLDAKSEDVLAKALGVGRVGVIGLLEGVEDLSGGRGLMELVRGSVRPAEVPWKDDLDRLIKGEWLGCKVEVVGRLDHPRER